MRCGCKIKYNYNPKDWAEVSIDWCPLHASAEEMLEFIKTATFGSGASIRNLFEMGKELITKAERKS